MSTSTLIDILSTIISFLEASLNKQQHFPAVAVDLKYAFYMAIYSCLCLCYKRRQLEL